LKSSPINICKPVGRSQFFGPIHWMMDDCMSAHDHSAGLFAMILVGLYNNQSYKNSSKNNIWSCFFVQYSDGLAIHRPQPTYLFSDKKIDERDLAGKFVLESGDIIASVASVHERPLEPVFPIAPIAEKNVKKRFHPIVF
jgi:hypothetical protein